VCFLLESEGTVLSENAVLSEKTVFSGDTLFQGGPGATGRSFSDFPTIIESIRTRLLPLPAGTSVLTGHGDPTTIGAEAPHLEEWIARGH
jgi:glyoxylase-like metal-dependent hydrolase (beta-lactamase superfamily II)